MKKIITKEIKKQEINHIFYCDNCRKLIGESEEYDDGYYEELGEYKLSFSIKNNRQYIFEMCLCDECKKIYDKKIIDVLKNIGFKEN